MQIVCFSIPNLMTNIYYQSMCSQAHLRYINLNVEEERLQVDQQHLHLHELTGLPLMCKLNTTTTTTTTSTYEKLWWISVGEAGVRWKLGSYKEVTWELMGGGWWVVV